MNFLQDEKNEILSLLVWATIVSIMDHLGSLCSLTEDRQVKDDQGRRKHLKLGGTVLRGHLFL